MVDEEHQKGKQEDRLGGERVHDRTEETEAEDQEDERRLREQGEDH